jgi:hypothetical protein
MNFLAIVDRHQCESAPRWVNGQQHHLRHTRRALKLTLNGWCGATSVAGTIDTACPAYGPNGLVGL